MEDIKWLEVAVNTTPERLDEVTAKLTAAGMASVVIEDEGDFKQFLEQNRQYWDYVDESLAQQMQGLSQIRLYLEDGPGAMEAVRALEAELALLRRQFPKEDLGTLQIEIANLQDEDWENNWKQYYQPSPSAGG